MDRFDATITERVCRALEQAGVGLDGLLEPLGVSDDIVRERLAARSSFTLEELVHIAAAVGCRTSDLLPPRGVR